MKSPAAVIALSIHILDTRHYRERPDWRERSKAFSGIQLLLRLGRANDRMRIYDALQGTNTDASSDTRQLSLELLDWMGAKEGGDGAMPSQQRASEGASKVRRSLEPPTELG
jgi:hypothetical protein